MRGKLLADRRSGAPSCSAVRGPQTLTRQIITCHNLFKFRTFQLTYRFSITSTEQQEQVPDCLPRSRLSPRGCEHQQQVSPGGTKHNFILD